ncbi:MAG: 30S ribosomal protein S5 [Patescibacteria group bacterium]|nr:30S ribosomal protein S5 [bacterium]MDZ4227103.1 30S ribosomal protein S5 [Patescibacteria group bacterium]
MTAEAETNTAQSKEAAAPAAPQRRSMPPRRGARGPRRGGPRDDRRSEFAQKLITIRRVARVMAGGRRFNFSAALVLGDKKGRVGLGLGKAADTATAIEKATRAAKRSMITVDLTKTRSIPHEIEAKFCASRVAIRPSPGRGLVAGSSVRTILELAGITDVTGKLLSRSHNSINNARAALKALQQISPAKGSNKSSGQK